MPPKPPTSETPSIPPSEVRLNYPDLDQYHNRLYTGEQTQPTVPQKPDKPTRRRGISRALYRAMQLGNDEAVENLKNDFDAE